MLRGSGVPADALVVDMSLATARDGMLCIRATLLLARPSLAFFAEDVRGPCDALRFDELDRRMPGLLLSFRRPLRLEELLLDRSRLIAATAEPEDSFSACLVSSSRVSASQHDAQAWTSRERPRFNCGGR